MRIVYPAIAMATWVRAVSLMPATGDRGGDAAGSGGVEEVHDQGHDHRCRLAGPYQAMQDGIGQDRIRIGQIPLQGDHARAGRQRAGVRDHHRALVDVGHPAVRVSGPGELVGVVRGGQPAADVDELPDALPGEPGDGAGQEQPVLPGPHRQQREHLYQACRLGPVGGVVVLPARLLP